jgi:predicted enzyme related to lactoylglutathione lyase
MIRSWLALVNHQLTGSATGFGTAQGIPARDVVQSPEFYRDVFGWRLRGDPKAPSFSDGTGHVIGHWRTDLPAAGEAGVLPYIVAHLDDTLRRATERGAELVTRPTRKGTSG